MILMIPDITSKIDDSTKTAACADDVTAAGKVIQLKALVENTSHDRSQNWTSSRGSNIMVNCKTESQATSIIGLQRYYNKNRDWRTIPSWTVTGSSKYKHKYVQSKIDELIKKINVLSMIAKTEPQAAYTCFLTAFTTNHRTSWGPYRTYHISWIS